MEDLPKTPSVTRSSAKQAKEREETLLRELANATARAEQAEADAAQLSRFIATRAGGPSVWGHEDVMVVGLCVANATLVSLRALDQMEAKGLPASYTTLRELIRTRGTENADKLMEQLRRDLRHPHLVSEAMLDDMRRALKAGDD